MGAGASMHGACVIMCHQRATLAVAPLVLSFCLLFDAGSLTG